MTTTSLHRSDLEKIKDTLEMALKFHRQRDAMNATLHLATTVRYSPLTSELEAAYERVTIALKKQQ